MPQLTIYVAAWNVPGPQPTFRLSGQPLSAFLTNPYTPTGATITVSLDFSRYNCLTPIPQFSVTQTQLDQALSVLLDGLPNTPVPPIGLILTTLFEPENLTEGFMFDGSAIPGAKFGARQGCALFWKAIQSAAATPAAAPDRLTFQAVHELGHALNLWHIPVGSAPTNFMTAPPPDDILPAALHFVPDQEAFLSHATEPTTCKFVLPGGSDFGDRGPIGPPGADPSSYAQDKPCRDLVLSVALSRRNQYAIEPVELDVAISLPKHSKTTRCRIPSEVDPGHGRLRIWMTYPSGEKKLFRCGRHFCPTGKMLTVTKTRAFQRDISIFQCADGFTFGMPGTYALQATYEVAPDFILKSNKVRCRVKPLPGDARNSMAALFQPEVIQLFRYKDFVASADLEEMLMSHVDRVNLPYLKSFAHYALGKGIARACAAGAAVQASDRRRGKEHLKIALSNSDFGKIRKRNALAAIDSLNARQASDGDSHNGLQQNMERKRGT